MSLVPSASVGPLVLHSFAPAQSVLRLPNQMSGKVPYILSSKLSGVGSGLLSVMLLFLDTRRSVAHWRGSPWQQGYESWALYRSSEGRPRRRGTLMQSVSHRSSAQSYNTWSPRSQQTACRAQLMPSEGNSTQQASLLVDCSISFSFLVQNTVLYRLGTEALQSTACKEGNSCPHDGNVS